MSEEAIPGLEASRTIPWADERQRAMAGMVIGLNHAASELEKALKNFGHLPGFEVARQVIELARQDILLTVNSDAYRLAALHSVDVNRLTVRRTTVDGVSFEEGQNG